MAHGLTFRLELDDGTAADPPAFGSASGVSWKAGDTIPLGGGRTLRVVETRPGRLESVVNNGERRDDYQRRDEYHHPEDVPAAAAAPEAA